MLPNPRTLRCALALAGLCLAAAPAVANADSLVFIKDHNVWLAKPDGTGLYQVTTDGTYASPYRSPSQADDGTIAVGHGNEILRMKQNGTVLNRLDPYPLQNSISHPMDGPAVDVAISPDGSRIAYTFVNYECGGGTVSCMARSATGYTAADHLTSPGPAGTTYFDDPSWVTSTRTLQFGGSGSQVDIHDVGTHDAVHWFDDAWGEDLGDGEVSSDGTKIAVVRSYGSNTHIMWWQLGSNAKTGTPAVGDPMQGCAVGPQEGLAGPTWSPDGTQLAFGFTDPDTEANEIWLKTPADDCDAQPRMLIAGGSEPDWGPADVNPGPRDSGGGTTAGGGTNPGGGPPVTISDVVTPRAVLTAKATKLAKALKRGLVVRLTHAAPGKRAVTAKLGKRVVARGTAKVAANGRATATLRFTPAGKRALRKVAKAKLTVSGAGARATVVLRR